MRNILLVVPDMTRKAHLNIVIPKLLKKIGTRGQGQGMKSALQISRVKIIVATGLHRPHTKAELKKLVGEKIFSKYLIINHSQNKKDLVNRGKTKGGIPIVLNKNVEKADSIFTVGLIEPHLYAGYSGGAKTIAIGLAGEETINATHHPRFLDKEGTSIGSIKDNPFQDCLWEIIEGLPIKYSLNVVNDRKGNIKKIFWGDPKSSFKAGVKFAKKIFEQRLNKRFDAVICKVDPPKDANLYQASRAFNYVLNTKRPIVKEGGLVLVCASLKEGLGNGIAERRFFETLKKVRSPQKFINVVKKRGCIAGEHRAYMVANALAKARLGFVGPRAPVYTKGLPFLSFPNMRSAIKFIKSKNGQNAMSCTIPNALSIILSR